MSTKMIAARALRYAGRPVAAGAEFSVKSQRDARVLRALGSAIPAPPPERPEPAAAEAKRATPRRTYRRRDMVAEAAVEAPKDATQAAPDPIAPPQPAAPADQAAIGDGLFAPVQD